MININFIFFIVFTLQLCSVHCATSNQQDNVQIFTKNINVFTSFVNQFYQQNKIEKEVYFQKYDFIIVGSGPGGCILANRLTENPKWSVLIIEAGQLETPIQNVPTITPYMVLSKYNWHIIGEKKEGACLGMKDQQCGMVRGKGLGGSSIIYFMVYNRGHKVDFDRWAAAGNIGWSFDDVWPYFLKTENSTLEDLIDSPNHNSNGLMNVEYNKARTHLAEAFVAANKYLGLKEVDYNSGHHQLGVSFLQGNTKSGQKQSAYKAFLEPIINRPNLHIMLNTRVSQILIDPKTKVAFGVEFIRNGRKSRVTARKEVILSSGTFHSPQLLMLSGIGMKNDLARIKVPLIQHLPVGKIIHDHMMHNGPTFITNTTNLSDNIGFRGAIGAARDYTEGRGLFTIPSGVEALSFIKTKHGLHYGDNVPDVELVFTPGSLHLDRGFGAKYAGRMNDETYNSAYKPLESVKTDTFIISQLIFHPKSKGFLKVVDKNIFTPPKIYPNFFSDPEDIEVLLEGIKFSLRLANTPPFQKIGARINASPLKNCAHIHFGSDDYWRCSLRTLTNSLAHQTSTCKMGPKNDPSAVVSPELKVYGIKNLRIVDTSVIPASITGHTNSASVMIGEKAADLIKSQWSDYE